MPTRFISGSLSLVGATGDEESLRVYREEEAYPASRLPFSCQLQRQLDGGGGDPHPAREDTLANLDAHAYHLGAPLLLLSVSPSAEVCCVSGAEGLWSRRYCEAGGRGISQ